MVLLLRFSMTFMSTILRETNGERLQARIALCREVGMPGVAVAILAEYIYLGVCLGMLPRKESAITLNPLMCHCRRILVTKTRYFLSLQ